VFKEQQGICDEYMFVSFFFQPMHEEQILLILTEKLRPKYGNEDFYEEALAKLFGQFFKEVKAFTSNINEYQYYFGILYPVAT